MRTKICIELCLISPIIGAIIGWKIGERIGISQLPPDAWAGSGIGILLQSIYGAAWGTLIGFVASAVCCYVWYRIVQRHRVTVAVPKTVAADDNKHTPV